MTGLHAFPEDKRAWTVAAVGALVLHGGAIAAIVAMTGKTAAIAEDPVMVVELPPPGPAEMATSPTVTATQQVQPVQAVAERLPDYVPPEVDIPETSAPLPTDPVRIPTPLRVPATPQPQPRIAAATPPPPAAAVAREVQGSGEAPGMDPRAKKKAADYYSLLMAHLQRKKRYPSEAKQARQQGVVTVRFTIDRSGNVTASSIKQSSGHTLLDRATLDLMQRVSPLPPIPREMQRESLTIALPIDYALSSK
ncbi:energy transducer TonB [Croceicoccus bisphenolivorans]|uniref:energy transducer TonB n=1 Tax=Croceicoccus bisphenolivorans TaxID=1783232 RepID=UPI00082E51A9|nr:energy transducer TonB [Croceicoccus bisphenolivorans]